MRATTALNFGLYRLAGPKGPLTRDGQEVPLRAKTLHVLWYLATHGGEIVEQDRLFAAIWPARVVSPGVLGVSIRELRQIFGDDPKAPRYIRTVHRHGYQFLPPVHGAVRGEIARSVSDGRLLLGRETELSRLQDWYQRARGGERQLLFVTGEAGIGKTTLVQGWMERSLAADEVWSGIGQCVEHGGAGEAYLCLLEALNRLCRAPQSEAVIATLRRHAPGWLAQLPAVLTRAEREALQPPQASVTPQHFQRELADALEALSAIRPVVLVLEDLHWCDASTVEALAVLARRPEFARLCVIATTRPQQLRARGHPLRSLKQELAWHGRCEELALKGLDATAVRTYVGLRLPAHDADAVADVVYRRTAGQPFFMAKLTDHLAQSTGPGSSLDASGLAAASAALPPGLRQLIEAQIEHLGEVEQQVLEAGSVAGPGFAVAAIAAALALPEDQVEQVCAELARRGQFIAARGPVEWPDGTPSETFAFRHGIYQEVLYRRVGISRRILLHRTIGNRLAQGHAPEAATLAVELAEHFEQGRDYCRAVRYHRLAGETALKRCAPVAARAHIERGLELIEHCPGNTARAEQELKLQLARGVALIASEGFGAPVVAQAYGRAHALCQQLPSSPALGPVLCGLWNYFLTRAELPQVRTLADELADLIDRAGPTRCLTPELNAVGQTRLYAGEPARALAEIGAGLRDYDQRRDRDLASRYGEDPLVVCHMYAAITHWLLGYPDTAVQHIARGLAQARELDQPFGIAQMRWAAMLVAQGRGDRGGVETQAQALIHLCTREEIRFWMGGARVLQGWAAAMRGHMAAGLASIHQGLAEWDASGSLLMRPYCLALLAEAMGRDGRPREALATLDEAIETVARSGERWYEAGLYALRAELLAQHDPDATTEVEASLQLALTIARRQEAAALELRAAVCLSRLWLAADRVQDVLDLLVPLHGRLVANGDTADLEQATRLIEQVTWRPSTPVNRTGGAGI